MARQPETDFPQKPRLTLCLDMARLRRIRALAEAHGLQAGSLVRMWVVERLNEIEAAESAPNKRSR